MSRRMMLVVLVACGFSSCIWSVRIGGNPFEIVTETFFWRWSGKTPLESGYAKISPSIAQSIHAVDFDLVGYWPRPGANLRLVCYQLVDPSATSNFALKFQNVIASATVDSGNTFSFHLRIPDSCGPTRHIVGKIDYYEDLIELAVIDSSGNYLPIVTKENLDCMSKNPASMTVVDSFVACLQSDVRQRPVSSPNKFGMYPVLQEVNRLHYDSWWM